MATVFPAYPASTLAQAEDLIIFTGNQLSDIVNGDSLSEVETVDGFIPTIRKTLVDNFGFKIPTDWSVGSNETVYNQLRKFTDGSWWWAPLATVSNPIAMTSDPYSNTNWKVFSKEQLTVFENTKRLAAEAGYNLVGTFYFGCTVTTITDVVLNERDGKYYSYGGTLPKVVAAGSSSVPASPTAWIDRTDVTLRNELDNSYPISFGYDADVESTPNYITYLNSNPKFSYGNVALGGGLDTQIPLSESGDFSMLSINGIKLQSAFVGGKPLKLPAAFPWNPGISAFSEAYGKVSLPFFDIAKYDFTVSSNTAFTSLYVDPVNGNNFQPIPNDSLPNSGTDPLFPLKSVNAAFDRITSNSYAFAAILLTGGYYYDTSSWGSRSPASNIVVKRWKRHDYRDTARIVLSSETKLTWGVYSGSTYSSVRSGVSWVLDSTNFNEYGDWLVYEKATTLALCQSTPGTWFQSDSTVYVHRINGGVVNSEIHVIVSKANAGCSAGNYTLYIDDIDFFGGSTGFAADSRTAGTSDEIYLNKCRFFYSAGNGFENYGISTCITKDCVAAYTVADGFNYHSNRDDLTQICKSMEINNRTYMTGRSDSVSVDTSNGSTCHESNIVIRLGGSYERSMGPVVADVQSCKTYNFCVSSRESIRAESTPRKSSFLASGDGCVQYLNNCQAVRSEWSLDVYNSAKMYVEDIFIDSSIEGIENISVIPT